MISNNRNNLFLEANLLRYMMVMSMLDYLVDEYMESVVAKLGEDDLAFLELLIPDSCDTPKSQPNGSLKQPCPDDSFDIHYTHSKKHSREELGAVRIILDRYIRFILEFPRLRQASASDQTNFVKI